MAYNDEAIKLYEEALKIRKSSENRNEQLVLFLKQFR